MRLDVYSSDIHLSVLFFCVRARIYMYRHSHIRDSSEDRKKDKCLHIQCHCVKRKLSLNVCFVFLFCFVVFFLLFYFFGGRGN
jgi:hypothetical protein